MRSVNLPSRLPSINVTFSRSKPEESTHAAKTPSNVVSLQQCTVMRAPPNAFSSIENALPDLENGSINSKKGNETERALATWRMAPIAAKQHTGAGARHFLAALKGAPRRSPSTGAQWPLSLHPPLLHPKTPVLLSKGICTKGETRPTHKTPHTPPPHKTTKKMKNPQSHFARRVNTKNFYKDLQL